MFSLTGTWNEIIKLQWQDLSASYVSLSGLYHWFMDNANQCPYLAKYLDFKWLQFMARRVAVTSKSWWYTRIYIRSDSAPRKRPIHNPSSSILESLLDALLFKGPLRTTLRLKTLKIFSWTLLTVTFYHSLHWLNTVNNRYWKGLIKNAKEVTIAAWQRQLVCNATVFTNKKCDCKSVDRGRRLLQLYDHTWQNPVMHQASYYG